MNISEFIYRIGLSKRNEGIWKDYQFLMESQYWDIQRLKDHQLLKLRELVKFGSRHSKYYSKKLKKHGVGSDDINSLQDIVLLPTLSKEELLAHNNDIHTNYNFTKKFLGETSGSTGQVLKFYKDMGWDNFNRANLFRFYSWYNVKPWDRNGYFWGFDFSRKEKIKTRVLDFLQNRYRLFNYDDESIAEFIKRSEHSSFIHGYSSMIYNVAKMINEKGYRKNFDSLKLIKGTSEKIFPNYHEETLKAFGKKIVSEYGAAESGLIAYECPNGNMHISMESVIVEEVDHEIVVTNLYSKSFPIIRYKLGDYIRLKDPSYKCECGRHHYIIEEVTGRVGKKIKGIRNEYPSLTLYYIFKNLALQKKINLNYQAFQFEPGFITLHIEQNLRTQDRALLENELNKYFGEDISYDIQDKWDPPKGKEKKKDFITSL